MIRTISNERAQWTNTGTRIVADGVIALIEAKCSPNTSKFRSVYFMLRYVSCVYVYEMCLYVRIEIFFNSRDLNSEGMCGWTDEKREKEDKLNSRKLNVFTSLYILSIK